MNRFTCPVLAVVMCLGLAQAQPSLAGDLEVGTGLAASSRAGHLAVAPGLSLRAQLDASADLADFSVQLRLEPRLELRGPDAANARFAPGLSEAYALWRSGNLDLSAGLERLPLETARLSVPYRLEPLDALGRRQGLLGVRATLYLDDWRLRPALLYRLQDARAGSSLSLRRSFASFELEGHLSYLARFGLGLTGSGLLGDTVLYGEAWLLTGPWEGRGALGASGYLGEALWTAELAYAPLPLSPESAAPQLLGQLGLPLGERGRFEASAGLALGSSALDSGALQLLALAAAGYALELGDEHLRLGLSFSHSELASLYGLEFSLGSSF